MVDEPDCGRCSDSSRGIRQRSQVCTHQCSRVEFPLLVPVEALCRRLHFSQNHLRNLTAGTSPWFSAAGERAAEDGAFGPEKEGAAWRRDVNGRSIQSRCFSESSPFIGTTKAKKLSC